MVDEPSLGLDPRMVELVLDTILTINREGTTNALSVSHHAFELGRNRLVISCASARAEWRPHR